MDREDPMDPRDAEDFAASMRKLWKKDAAPDIDRPGHEIYHQLSEFREPDGDDVGYSKKVPDA